MAIGGLKDILHRIKAKLYPNYLPGVEGAYIARTDNEATLSVEEVCTALKNRGGFSGRYDELITCVKQYLDECAYQLCDGYAVSTGYYSIHPNIGGTFNSEKELHNHQKHPITFRFRGHAPLRRLVEHIDIEITGIADGSGYIAEFFDLGTGAVNETVSGGAQFVIAGHRIKVAGDNPACGVYFECVEEAGQRIKVGGLLAENTGSKVIGIVPALIASRNYRVIIVTQYSAGSSLLKEPRTITSGFTLSAGV
jgi:hypothetical protein